MGKFKHQFCLMYHISFHIRFEANDLIRSKQFVRPMIRTEKFVKFHTHTIAFEKYNIVIFDVS